MNNIYGILDKLNSLTQKQDEQDNKKSQPIYESVEAQGSILEGVAKVEQKLKEQFSAMKEGESSYKDGVLKHRGSYGTEYQGDPDEEEDDTFRKRGRPAKGDTRVSKPKKEKGARGRPKKAAAPTHTKSNDPFGRVPDKAPKGKKGEVHKMGEAAKNPFAIGMAQAKKEVGLGRAKATGLPKSVVKKAHHIGKTIKANESKLEQRFVAEGRMIDESGETLQHILNRFRHEVRNFEQGGDLDKDLYDALYDYYCENGDMPYGVQKARTGDPMNWVAERLDVELGNHAYGSDPANAEDFEEAFTPRQKMEIPAYKRKASGDKDWNIKQSDFDAVKADNLSSREGLARRARELGISHDSDVHEEETMESELNELAKLAGLKVTDEGNAFTGKLAQTKKGDKFELDGKTYKDTSSLDESTCPTCHADPCKCDADVEEGNEFSGALAKAKAQHKNSFEVDGKKYPVKESQLDECGEMSPVGSAMQAMHDQQGKISVSTNSSTDGTKSITVNADGEAAAELMQMLKMAGLGVAGHQHEKPTAVVIAQEAKAYGDTDVEDAPEAVNKPRPDVRGMHRAETVGYAATSDDLHKQKGQHPKAAAKGDNPLAEKEKETKLETNEGLVDPIEALGRRLMKEYESIKITK